LTRRRKISKKLEEGEGDVANIQEVNDWFENKMTKGIIRRIPQFRSKKALEQWYNGPDKGHPDDTHMSRELKDRIKEIEGQDGEPTREELIVRETGKATVDGWDWRDYTRKRKEKEAIQREYFDEYPTRQERKAMPLPRYRFVHSEHTGASLLVRMIAAAVKYSIPVHVATKRAGILAWYAQYANSLSSSAQAAVKAKITTITKWLTTNVPVSNRFKAGNLVATIRRADGQISLYSITQDDYLAFLHEMRQLVYEALVYPIASNLFRGDLADQLNSEMKASGYEQGVQEKKEEIELFIPNTAYANFFNQQIYPLIEIDFDEVFTYKPDGEAGKAGYGNEYLQQTITNYMSNPHCFLLGKKPYQMFMQNIILLLNKFAYDEGFFIDYATMTPIGLKAGTDPAIFFMNHAHSRLMKLLNLTSLDFLHLLLQCPSANYDIVFVANSPDQVPIADVNVPLKQKLSELKERLWRNANKKELAAVKEVDGGSHMKDIKMMGREYMVDSKKSKEAATHHKLEEKLAELRKTDVVEEQIDLSSNPPRSLSPTEMTGGSVFPPQPSGGEK
jgi:hypothetical protein